jgi:hypothetical protein
MRRLGRAPTWGRWRLRIQFRRFRSRRERIAIVIGHRLRAEVAGVEAAAVEMKKT